MRHPTPAPPAELGRDDGLAYALFLPEGKPLGGVVILHGAGSAKESHFDYARAARASGFGALAFDARGHGASEGALGGSAVDDVARMAERLRGAIGVAGPAAPRPPASGPSAADPAGARPPIALRGSSMGGYLALVSAAAAGAAAVVAICPAGSDHLLRGLRAGRFEFEADAPALEALLEARDAADAVAALPCPLLLLHAEGDEQIPVEHSHILAALAPERTRLLAMPGGHHRSIQHDAELQGETLRWIRRAFRGSAPAGPPAGV